MRRWTGSPHQIHFYSIAPGVRKNALGVAALFNYAIHKRLGVILFVRGILLAVQSSLLVVGPVR